MLETLRDLIGPYYLHIKALHVLSGALWSFSTAKVWLGLLVILPMEVWDIDLSHRGGNKARARAAGDPEHLERVMGGHLRFLRVTEPIVVMLIPAMFFIAIVKPF